MLTCVFIYSHELAEPITLDQFSIAIVKGKEDGFYFVSFCFVSFHLRFHSGFYKMPSQCTVRNQLFVIKLSASATIRIVIGYFCEIDLNPV